MPQFKWSTTLRKVDDLLLFGQRAAEFLRQLSELRILDGRFIDVTFPGTNSVEALHGLGRQYYGVILVRSTSATGQPLVTVLDPASTEAIGIDSTKYVALGSTAVTSQTVTLWVF